MPTPAATAAQFAREESTIYEDFQHAHSDETITDATTSPNTPSLLLRTSSTFGVVDGSIQSPRITMSSTDVLSQEPMSPRESLGPNRRSSQPAETTLSVPLSPVPSLEDIEKVCTRSMTSVASDSDTEREFPDDDEPWPHQLSRSSLFLVEPYYLNYIRLLSLELSHLAYSPIRPQYDVMSLAVLDFGAHSSNCRTRLLCHGSASSLSQAERANMTKVLEESASLMSDDAKTSLIVAEDLSCEVINLLGSTFELSPELFETHLVNSRYARPSPRQMPLPLSTWSTASAPKDFQSIKWFRPVWRSPGAGAQRLWNIYAGRPFHGPIASPHRIKKGSCGLLYFANNIVRFGWDLAAEPNRLSSKKTDLSTDDAGMPLAWEERATFCIRTIGERRSIVLLLDPFPVVKEMTASGQSNSVPEFHGNADSEQSGKWNQDYVFCRDTYPRSPIEVSLQEVDINNCAKVRQQLGESESTASYLRKWCEAKHKKSWSSIYKDPLEGLNAIVCHDSLNLFRVVNETLDHIQSSLADDHLTDTQLCHWQKFIKRCEANIPALRTTLRSLVPSVQSTTVEPSSRSMMQLSSETLEVAAATSDRLREVSASLISSITMLETRQNIAKEKSITTLSELAFFLVPIAVSASIFSMRVRELDHAPIWAFFVLSIVLLLLSYGLRWTIGRHILQRCKRRYLGQSSHEIYHDDLMDRRSTTISGFMRWVREQVRVPSIATFVPKIRMDFPKTLGLFRRAPHTSQEGGQEASV